MQTNKIRMAMAEEENEMVSLWMECFPDSEEYVRLFWEKNLQRMEAWVILEGDVIAGGVFLLPAVVEDGKREQEAYMIYAAGVRKIFRSHGRMKALLGHLAEDKWKEGKMLFLKPANDGLKDYYLSLGFREDASWSVVPIIPSDPVEKVSFGPVDAEEYRQLREKAFAGRAYVRWDTDHISWSIEENRFCGGWAELVIYHGNRYVLLCIRKGSELTILETTMTKSVLEELAGSIAKRYGVSHISWYAEYLGKEYPCITASMSIYNQIKSPYVNLMLI